MSAGIPVEHISRSKIIGSRGKCIYNLHGYLLLPFESDLWEGTRHIQVDT